MSSECVYLSKEITQEVLEPICDRFLGLFEEMCEKEKIKPAYAQLGLALALAFTTKYFQVTMNLGSDFYEIAKEVNAVLEKSEKKGVHFAVRACSTGNTCSDNSWH